MEKRDEPLAVLLRELRDETQMLIRKEVELARTELRGKTRQAMRQAVWLALGGAVLLVGFFELVAALDRGLTAAFAEAMHLQIAVWFAPLVLALLLFALGAVLVRRAMHKLKEDTKPEHTLDSLDKTRRWAKGPHASGHKM